MRIWDTDGTQWAPFPSLVYSEFLTLEGVCGQNRRPSFVFISATNFSFCESLSQKSPLSQKLCAILYFISHFHGLKVTILYPLQIWDLFFLIVLGSWHWHNDTQYKFADYSKEKDEKKRKEKENKRIGKTLLYFAMLHHTWQCLSLIIHLFFN